MLRVVLVEPHYPGNAGSIARVMANFGLRDLVLVNPHFEKDDEEALRMAVHARDILLRARVVENLADAVRDAGTVVATTAKTMDKKVRRTPITPKELATSLGPAIYSARTTVALLFGREPSGLTNDELEMADVTVTIPTSPEYPAMNLSHSVAVILYEIYASKHDFAPRDPPRDESLRLADRYFEEIAAWIGRKNLLETVKSWRSILRRGARTNKEVMAVVGVLSEVKKRCMDKNS